MIKPFDMQPFALERYFAKYEFKTKYNLSASDCEALTMKELLDLADSESRRMWDQLALGYTESLGHPRLLDQISRLYRTITPDEILVAAPEELIFLLMNSILSKGEEIIVTTPAYQSLHELAASLGCRVIKWELTPTGSGWHLDMQFLADHISDKTKLLVINFPHNPTGHHISRADQDEIVRLARNHNVAVFSDEMYRGAEYRDEDQIPAIADEYELGTSLWGLSKSFGLPGLRIGWLASRNADVLTKCSHFKDYTTICNSAPAEILAIIALKAKETILRRTRELIRKNLSSADDFFGRHKELFTWLRPKAGSVAFPILRKDIPVEQFCTNLVESKDLLVTPGSLFQHRGNHFRIGFGRKNFPEAIAILDRSL
jgi:aspartate/methionine/tyrosine aminotransferase